jgi:preprotein translocase subunit YajC
MDMNSLTAVLAMAPVPPGAAGQQSQSPLMSFAPMILIIVVFYFLLIRPQQKKAKQQAEMLKALKSGDRVGTASGITGVVLSVKDNMVMLRSGDSKLEMTKGSITEILPSEAPSAS